MIFGKFMLGLGILALLGMGLGSVALALEGNGPEFQGVVSDCGGGGCSREIGANAEYVGGGCQIDNDCQSECQNGSEECDNASQDCPKYSGCSGGGCGF